MSIYDCGYCEKLLCGGSVSDEKTFFTLSARLLCGLGAIIAPCAISDREVKVNLTQALLTQEQLDYFNGFSIPETGAQIFNVNLPNNIADEVNPGDLLPGANSAIRTPFFRIEGNYPECRDIIASISVQFTNIGPDALPSTFGYLLYFLDADLNIIGGVGPSSPIVVPAGGNDFIDVTGSVPGALNLTYIILSIPVLDVLPGGFSTASFYSIVDFRISTATPTNECPDQNTVRGNICNLPRGDRQLNVVPEIFCDDNGAYVRHYRYGGDGYMLAPITTDINLSPYFAVGVESICSGGATPVVGSGGVVTIF